MSDDDREQGTDPTEEVGPDGSDARVGDCELTKVEIEDPDIHPSFMEEIQDAYAPEQARMVMSPDDGLPIPANERSDLAIAPAFTIENVICVEDDRQYVELFSEDVSPGKHAGMLKRAMERYPHSDRFRIGLRSAYNEEGQASVRRQFDPARIVSKWGVQFIQLLNEELSEKEKAVLQAGSDLPHVFVRPIRERCQHYKRQVLANEDEPDPTKFGHRIVYRNCMARRSVGGAFLSVRDEAVYACDYRDPPDPGSIQKYLDDPDRQRLRSDDHKVRVPLFGAGIFEK